VKNRYSRKVTFRDVARWFPIERCSEREVEQYYREMAVDCYMSEELEEYRLGFFKSRKLDRRFEQIQDILRMSKKRVIRNAYRWYLDRFCYINIDLHRRFKGLSRKLDDVVWGSCIEWHDGSDKEYFGYSRSFQVVGLRGKLVRVPKGGLYWIYV